MRRNRMSRVAEATEQQSDSRNPLRTKSVPTVAYRILGLGGFGTRLEGWNSRGYRANLLCQASQLGDL